MCSLLRQWWQEWLPGLSTPTHWQAVKKEGEREKKETCVRWLPNLKEKRREKERKEIKKLRPKNLEKVRLR